MQMNFRKDVGFVVALLLCAGLVVSVPSYAKEPKKLAILPFTMNADRDLSFLQEGITDMLASRLAWKGELEILEKGLVKEAASRHKGPLSKETALAIGKGLQVDYVIIGSLTVFGDSVSIDSKILEVTKGEELVTAFNQAKGMDAVIPTVTQFAQDINEKIMGRVVAAPAQQPGRPEGPRGPSGLMGEGQAFEGKGVSHSQGFKAEVTSMDVGDVDGDGKNELVFVDSDTVFVHKWAEKGFHQFKAVKEKYGANYVWVNVADLDGNGKAEIYVSNAREAGISSFVLEWDGNDFKKISEGQPWFFRVMEIPGSGRVLVGQRRETGGGFSGPLEFLKREGNRFVPTGKVEVHREANIFNFVMADLGVPGSVDTVVLDSLEILRLYGGGTEEIWRSEEQYGGTYTFIQKDNPDMSKDHEFISSPIHVTDVDEDGKKEIMICKNVTSTGRFWKKFRDFSGGTVHFLTRDLAGLNLKWSTKRLGGGLVGYQVADVDNDGLPELVIGTVMKEERLYGTPRTRIIVYDLK